MCTKNGQWRGDPVLPGPWEAEIVAGVFGIYGAMIGWLVAGLAGVPMGLVVVLIYYASEKMRKYRQGRSLWPPPKPNRDDEGEE